MLGSGGNCAHGGGTHAGPPSMRVKGRGGGSGRGNAAAGIGVDMLDWGSPQSTDLSEITSQPLLPMLNEANIYKHSTFNTSIMGGIATGRHSSHFLSRLAMDSSQQANVGPMRSTSGKAGPAQQQRSPITRDEFVELFGGMYRSNAVAIVHVCLPHLDHTKMDDVELLFWGRYYGAYQGSFNNWLALMKSKFKTGNNTEKQAKERLRKHAKVVLDQSIPIFGFTIHVWGTGMEASHMYNLDFVNKATLKHIQPPLSCQLYTIHSPNKWWLPNFCCGKVEMAPGSEMYQVFKGDSFMLSVGIDMRVVFDIPVRRSLVKPDWLLGTTTVTFTHSMT
ncbi:uncharacterized protein LAESUDRAFT_717710 [Laetiporus sulphureus 93-53]|uniref:Uncharacterized protein n=1 Tax=Laetiporus sulphureus 93-53 TaxID=1314785 RepID=A0A165BHY9_9APHY|nr:uncharacterized protein LAESUDRAFT_717710 [Laetiporus sulphureus 93-53]KZT01094.1 hypothetical protein LAESUDRAFT_717710 [Laetiporus sulphureus 93-53]